MKELSQFMYVLGYQFQQVELLEQALTHRSFRKDNNERLEFLGDAVLGLVIAEALYQKFPEAREGQLSRLRASLVRGESLAAIAREMNLGDFLRLGIGELKSGGFSRKSTLEDATEALLGAVYLDGGLEVVRAVILHWFEKRLDQLTLKTEVKDAKSLLQEALQSAQLALPLYRVTRTKGKEHNQTFYVACLVAELDINTQGEGKSRKAAEQAAAKTALHKVAEVLEKKGKKQ